MDVNVWLVSYDTGDFYCEGDHLAGVFTSRELAEKVKEHLDTRYAGNIGWQCVVDEVTVNTLFPTALEDHA